MVRNLEEDFVRGNPFEVLQERLMSALNPFIGMMSTPQMQAQVEVAVRSALLRFLEEWHPPLKGLYSALAKATQVSCTHDEISVQLPAEVKEWLVSRLP